jgi:hypothetical protein
MSNNFEHFCRAMKQERVLKILEEEKSMVKLLRIIENEIPEGHLRNYLQTT